VSTKAECCTALTFGCGAAASRKLSTSGGWWCGKNQSPPPSSGSTSASRRPEWCARSARSRQQPGRRLAFEVGRGEPRQADHRSDPSKIGGATCQPYVRDGQVRQPPPCSPSRLRIAE